ncbi:phosphoglycerate mutase (2,3-diphosphoglycerate-independent) [Candidatus Woesebacteria bacterium RIFCSPLOWO2_01_FULL_39_61]|uniref:2,3-bisphosphoglycerate-independent phosphoglycerate mutase n=1 Tax=Candidatus Woesebacteria bacterium RIFCSPHIGHO2_02_FULL_39_13 TaxID=1802505 RepID=A0A1F7Z394_9BACT|nr:MAG: phosphoglycerate mutase (2,3-diphosphoglycerate-independent) [Candidatus Woesebacteria bacterium RIFCSPHIGHO2_01_FULL_39_95]OGM34133.1 MAG: phosphoglycerate mutase (2,3-diphosphoglycerate-independent) [Candidatus Woesebacteria bacterium RIFCSPHIGHO2_02_FULL_39_13]OGM38732.1 MAG: phosphoglycerate mutase (2,3-diphosphoglycerate-independent) [Candidatus Woesebacteria bacterium RIFCSPHIGHO2_12_FULL_40_20]OGM67593.1 MAG: phosphoglycerate mutase (2,3-diphosphoglycerate-independent) [Candidatus
MFNLPFFGNRDKKIKPVVLVILDGFGLAPPSEGNAITLANTPNYRAYLKNFPNTELIASGESVGLPANEVGNTEVGHLTLGAGRVILQDLKRIDVQIEKGYFFDNKVLLSAATHVKKYNSGFHILGLIGSGHVHSSMSHLYALLQFCKKESLEKVYLHLFTDGRDSPPKQGLEIVEGLERYLEAIKIGKIASITGRYYAMDRDRRWDRTEKAYNALVSSHAIQTFTALDAVKNAYLRGQTDEFIEPTLIAGKDGPLGLVNNDDAIVFFNFRVDRPKQLTMAFIMPDFENLKSFDFGYDPETNKKLGELEVGKTFQRSKVLKNLFFVTMTEYQKGLPVSGVAFGPEVVLNTISEVLANSGLRQMHMGESEKERFVKYYFNGLKEEKVAGEDDHIVSSLKVATYDQKPEMSLPSLTKAFKDELNKDEYHFFVINIANPDMVAHSGNLKATIRAIEFVDRYLAELVSVVLGVDGTVFVTADHGNAEELLTFPSSSYFFTTSKGSVNTDHSNNPVPLIIINNSLKEKGISIAKGALSDVAPTILALIGIQKPEVMTGKNLLAAIGNITNKSVMN